MSPQGRPPVLDSVIAPLEPGQKPVILTVDLPSIHHERLPVDPRGVVAGQEEDGSGDVVRLAGTPQGNRVDEPLSHRWAGRRSHGSLDEPRRDGVDSDAFTPDFEGGDTREHL